MGTPSHQLLSGDGIILLEFSAFGGGRTFRYCTHSTEVEVSSSASGESYIFAPGMGDLPIRFVGGRAIDKLSVSIHAGPPEGWAYLVWQGYRLELGEAVVRLYYPGQTLEQAQVVLRGRTVDPSYGDDFEPLTFAIERRMGQQGTILTSSMEVSTATWPASGSANYVVPDASEGVMYPLVIGYPGYYIPSRGTVTINFSPAVPAPMVEYYRFGPNYCRLLVAGHPVHAAKIHLINYSAYSDSGAVSNTNLAERPIHEMEDALGRTVSYVDFVGLIGARSLYPDPEQDWRVAFVPDSGYGGGLPNAEGTAPMRGAGEVLAYLLRTWSTIPVDWSRMEAQASYLDGYLLDFFINEQVSTWSWIQANLLPILPMEWVDGPAGGYFRVIRWGASASDAVGHLDASPGASTQNVERASKVGSSSQIFNEITFKFAVGGPQNLPRASVIVTASQRNPEGITDTRIIPHPACAASQSLYGVLPLTIVSTVVHDPATAARMAVDLARELALPRRTLQISGGVWLDRFDPGDVITFSDSTIYVDAEVALVREKEVRGGEVRLVILLLDSSI